MSQNRNYDIQIMDRHSILDYDVETHFDRFLSALRRQEEAEWRWLHRHFQAKVLPWIRKKNGRLPAHAIVSTSYFVEEVFAQSLIRFYELFQTGQFEDLGQIRGLMFKIADLKLKEGYRKLDRDRLVFKQAREPQGAKVQTELEATEDLKVQQEIVRKLEKEFDALSQADRELLELYFNGESYREIALALNVKESVCRKRKQRLIERLRKMVLILF